MITKPQLMSAIGKISLITLLYSCIGILELTADTLKLNDGKIITGKILTEDADKVRIRVEIPGKPGTLKTYTKSEINEIKRTSKATKDFARIKALLPTPDFLTESKYDFRLQQVENFLRKHYDAPESKGAGKILMILQEEKAKVVAGQIKLEGKWQDQEAQKSHIVVLDAWLLREEIEKNLARENYSAALPQLSLFQKLYDQTAAAENFRDYQTVLGLYERKLTKMKANHAEVTRIRDQNLQRLNSSDLNRYVEGLEKDKKAYEQAMVTAKRKGYRWKPIDKYNLASLESAIRFVNRELKRLERPITTYKKKKNLAEIYSKAYSLIKEGKLEDAKPFVYEIERMKEAAKYAKILNQLIQEVK